MLDLLLSFRANNHVFWADIRKAFLMICLELEAEKNRICFSLKDRGCLHYFRYTAIIHGFTSSPFILNFILSYHAQFPLDPCRYMIGNSFYAGNLVTNGDCPDELCKLYSLSRKRLQQGLVEVSSCSLATQTGILAQSSLWHGTYCIHWICL